MNKHIMDYLEYSMTNPAKPIKCEDCDQGVHLGKRRLNSAMAYGLILIYKEFKNKPELDWLHIEDFFKKQKCRSSIRGDVAKLRYWGLLKQKVDIRPDGSKRVGFYKITPKGIAFVLNKIMVPEKVMLYNQTDYGFTGEYIYIRQIKLGFDYRELMEN